MPFELELSGFSVLYFCMSMVLFSHTARFVSAAVTWVLPFWDQQGIMISNFPYLCLAGYHLYSFIVIWMVLLAGLDRHGTGDGLFHTWFPCVALLVHPRASKAGSSSWPKPLFLQGFVLGCRANVMPLLLHVSSVVGIAFSSAVLVWRANYVRTCSL
jgi:hypothetical protein